MAMGELNLKNRLEDLSLLGRWVDDRAEQLGISQRGSFRLQLVLEEVVTNVIQNAYLDSDEHAILIKLDYQEGAIHVAVIDDGIAFNPLEHPEVSLPGKLEEAQVGGLGIYLMRRYTDACDYQRQDNVNILTMTICDRVTQN
jgi:anti-sigma regulatory factor (Ser/Thr protein kinase)